jgi:hypothetical protein
MDVQAGSRPVDAGHGAGLHASRPVPSGLRPALVVETQRLPENPREGREHLGMRAGRARSLRPLLRLYNHEHHHDALGLCTPHEVHRGLAAETLDRRAAILDAAFLTHPERFPHGRPVPPSLPTEVWINKPQPTSRQKTPLSKFIHGVSQTR